MRYFVVAEDGSKYGPADVELLNAWIEEGRLLPRMELVEEGSQHKVTAASVEQLDFYILEAPTATEIPNGEFRPGDTLALTYEPPTAHESEKADMFLSWAMAVVTLCLAAVRPIAGVLGCFTAILGIVAAWKAKDRGYESAGVALAMNLLALIIWAIARLYFITR